MEYLYTKSNRLIEFPEFGKNFTKYLTLKSFALTIDYLIVIALELILYFVSGFQWYVIGFIGVTWMLLYSTILLILNRRTVGMMCTKLYAAHASGFVTSNRDVFFRGLLMSVYAFPIIGWALILTNVITAPFWKGITLLDFASRTTVITKYTYNKFEKVEDETSIEDIYLNLKGEKNE